MMDRITKALTAEKYHLPKVGQYTGAQLAEMLETSHAPAATVEAFRKYVVPDFVIGTPKNFRQRVFQWFCAVS